MASVWDGVECFAECCTNQVLSKWLCRKHISRYDRHGSIEVVRYLDPVDAIRERADEDEDGCQIWQGYKHPESGYGQMGFKGKLLAPHIVAWVLAGNERPPKGQYLDHICYKRDCVNVDHLRVVGKKQNAENLSKLMKHNKSGYRGVSLYKRDGVYVAQVGHNGETLYLGRYPTAKEAAIVSLKKRLELFTHNDQDRILAKEWGIVV